jgi:hypothetical protein
VPWDQALEAILEANNMSMRLLQRRHLVVEDMGRRGQRQREEPTVTQAFPIQYISADSIRRRCRACSRRSSAASRSTRRRTRCSSRTPSPSSGCGEIIPQLDARTPQVDITATIAFIDRTTLEAFGVVYDLKDSRGNQFNRLVTGFVPDGEDGLEPVDRGRVLLGGNSIAALGNANYRVPSPALEIVTTLVLGRHSLISFIEALQTVSLSDIQAKPVLRTMDHRLATIQVGEETPIRVIDAGAGGGGGRWRGRAPPSR